MYWSYLRARGADEACISENGRVGWAIATSSHTSHPPTFHLTRSPYQQQRQGPKGELSRTLHPLVTISQEGNVVTVNRAKEHKTANAIHGLERSLVNNMVIGCSTGYEKTLSMIGVGYRAAVNGKTLTLSLGYSHPVEMEIPEGISVEVVKNTTIVVRT